MMTGLHSDRSADSKKKALLIAVQDNGVEDFPKLIHAQHDARELYRFLPDVYAFAKDNITLMMDHHSVQKELWPTEINIRKQIQLFVQGASAGDRLFFYYSGHGYQVPCRHYTELDGLDEVIYTCNGKQIMDNDLRKWLVDPLPRGCKLFALWDSCHSQTMLDLDHHFCNEPRGGQHAPQCHVESKALPIFWKVLPKPFRSLAFKSVSNRSRSSRHQEKRDTTQLPRSAYTIALHELRGRQVSRAPASTITISAGGSPLRPLSKWIPFMENMQRVLSPPPWPKCDGKCSPQTPSDAKHAHVISLSACKDNEIAVDDCYNGTVTKFFMDHLRANRESTLGELLLAIRKRVDEITAARKAWDMEARVISRQTTFANGSKIKTEWTPQVVRRKTEINVGTVEEFLQIMPSVARERDDDEYSQKPSYSSHYRLDLDERVDL